MSGNKLDKQAALSIIETLRENADTETQKDALGAVAIFIQENCRAPDYSMTSRQMENRINELLIKGGYIDGDAVKHRNNSEKKPDN